MAANSPLHLNNALGACVTAENRQPNEIALVPCKLGTASVAALASGRLKTRCWNPLRTTSCLAAGAFTCPLHSTSTPATPRPPRGTSPRPKYEASIPSSLDIDVILKSVAILSRVRRASVSGRPDVLFGDPQALAKRVGSLLAGDGSERLGMSMLQEEKEALPPHSSCGQSRTNSALHRIWF